jgi:hypothetical protein
VKDQLRLKLILPLVAVAIGGLAAAKFVLLDEDSSEAVAAPAAATSPAPSSPEPAPPVTDPAETESVPSDELAGEEDEAGSEEEVETGLAKLERKLLKKPIVVVVVYTKNGAVDALQVSEARAAAEDVGVGFLALNGRKQSDVEELAKAYDIRTTPLVLIVRRGPELAARFEKYADRETVAQAAELAK